MLDAFFIFGAKYLFIAPLALSAVFFYRASRDTRRQVLIFALFVLPLAFLIAVAARELYLNPRPFVVGNFMPLVEHEPDNGFPSDHVLLVAALASIISLFNRRLGLWLWFITFVVALSRVYVGVHHFTDVSASILITLLSAFIVHAVLRWRKSYNESKQ